ncbi:hypothetical protein K504DRAFT_47842 [Pleomassaria siparia CBS 279.74]|uniref:Helicase C-terminal domain-containing protein n=1 Tax=Pleomassaria siparia CBS 279.74 TaxID=1314801 RepID=A0A6G1JQ22_9PLEO|nr:hypothetical protein K504DRAFT_47842 [Pleomassaria siparia CBS 279.74]
MCLNVNALTKWCADIPNPPSPPVVQSQEERDDATALARERELDEETRRMVHWIATQQDQAKGWDDDITERNADAELEAMRRSNAEITKDVAAVASRISDPNYRRAVRLFDLDFDVLTTSYDLIPFPATWKLAPGAGLFAHQWLSLSEMLFQSIALGGGVDGSSMGVGKTHPAVGLAILEYWIVRLQRAVELSREERREGEHHPEDHATENDPCPSQASSPLPCPCSWSSPIHPSKMAMESGAAFLCVLARTGREWVKCLENFFTDAPLLTDKFMPIRIRIDHDDILALANERAWRAHMQNLAIEDTEADDTRRKPRDWTHPFARKTNKGDMKRLCRLPDFHEGLERWEKEELTPVSGYATTKTKPTGLPTPPPRDATHERASLVAKQYIVLVTPQVMWNRIRHYVYKRQAIGSDSSRIADTITSDPLLDCSLFIWDEAHNYQKENGTLMAIVGIQDRKRKADGSRFHYWMLSGTIRENGPYTLANHLGLLVSEESWADGYEADAGEVVPDEETRTKCLRFITAWANDDTPEETESTGNKATPPPYTQFLKEYKSTLQAAGKDKSVDAITRQPTFVSFTQKMAEIVKTFVIERDEDTKRLDGKPLLVTANITVDSRDVPITYDSKDVQELATLKEAVERDRDALYRAAYEKWAAKPSGRPAPQKKSQALCSGFYEVVLASTTPGLVRWSRGTTGQKSLRVNDIKHWLDDPSKSPLYDQFDEIIKGDKKWERLMRDIDDMESTKKTAKRSEGARNKCLIGVNLPVIAHLYAIGLARRFNHAHGKPKDTAEIEKRVATTIHAGMNQRTRTEHIDVFNTLTSNTRYFVCTVDVLAEGVNMTGANYVIVVDPHARSDKVKQFKARPHRYGQLEDTLHVRQYYNTRSTVDGSIMTNQKFKTLLNDTVSAMRNDKDKAGHVESGHE